MDADIIYGCLLGKAIADSIGATFEGQTAESLHRRFNSKEEMFRYSADAPRCYTDDTEMALALSTYLCENDNIEPIELMATFVAKYQHGRGYGRGTRRLVEAFRMGEDYEFLVGHLFPGGSWGNGAAMRAAPVGLRFHHDLDTVWAQAKRSAWPTHRNELGIEGAQLIAVATAVSASQIDVSPRSLAKELSHRTETTVFKKQLEGLAELRDETQLQQFGNGIEAHASAVTAIACFALFPDDYRQAVATALWLGGDTDTIAAMTGALCGARAGCDFDESLTGPLEPETDFVEEARTLAERLAVRCG